MLHYIVIDNHIYMIYIINIPIYYLKMYKYLNTKKIGFYQLKKCVKIEAS